MQEYTVDSALGLVASSFPAYEVVSDTSGTTSNSIESNVMIKGSDIEGSGWENLQTISSDKALMVNRTRYQKNEDFEITGKMACLIKPATNGSTYAEYRFKVADVELGNVVQDEENYNSGSGTNASRLGDDDILWINWEESYLLLGVNHQKGELHMQRVHSAPIYPGRELPGVDSSDTEARSSGMESFIRSCNSDAGESGATFAVIYPSSSSNLQTNALNAAAANNFCSGLNAATNSTTLSGTYAAGQSCTGWTSGTTQVTTVGTWNGSAHTGPIGTVTAATANHVEATSIWKVKVNSEASEDEEIEAGAADANAEDEDDDEEES